MATRHGAMLFGFGLLFSLSLGPSGARAQAPTDGAPGRDWSAVDRRATTVYRAGWIAGAAGLGTELLGMFTENSALIVLGDAAGTSSPAIMAGGTLRARRALREQGHDPGGTLGYTAWGLWGAGLVFSLGTFTEEDEDIAAQLALAGLGCHVGSYVLGILQAERNRRVRWGAGLAEGAPLPEPGGVQWALVPTASRERVGLSLDLRF